MTQQSQVSSSLHKEGEGGVHNSTHWAVGAIPESEHTAGPWDLTLGISEIFIFQGYLVML